MGGAAYRLSNAARSFALSRTLSLSLSLSDQIFAVCFIISRNFLYPYCCWSALIESKRLLTAPPGLDWRVCNALLQVLLVLQFYWTSLIFIAVYKQMKNGGIEDIRSDDEESEEEEMKVARKKKK